MYQKYAQIAIDCSVSEISEIGSETTGLFKSSATLSSATDLNTTVSLSKHMFRLISCQS